MGAWPSQLRPYNVREAMKIQAEPLLNAEVQTTALMMEGTTDTPDRSKAMTKGDCVAVPVERLRAVSSYGLMPVEFKSVFGFRLEVQENV